MFLNTGIGLEISKSYSSYSFYPIWAKRYVNKSVRREYKIMDILAINLPKIKNFLAFWCFNIGVNVES